MINPKKLFIFFKSLLERTLIRRKLRPQIKLFFNTPTPGLYFQIPKIDSNNIYIATVAYNNSQAISHQIRLVTKYLSDCYVYIVLDNSSDPKSSLKIEQLCAESNIHYINLPNNPYSGFDPSFSHGLALQWFLKNWVIPKKIKYFGFIDHDIYPIRRTTLTDKLNDAPCYGHIQYRGNYWYLWPGFCFINTDKINPVTLNFLPVHSMQMDTGGGNWKALSKIELQTIEVPKYRLQNITNSTEKQNNSIEFIGDWAHTFNASGWMTH